MYYQYTSLWPGTENASPRVDPEKTPLKQQLRVHPPHYTLKIAYGEYGAADYALYSMRGLYGVYGVHGTPRSPPRLSFDTPPDGRVAELVFRVEMLRVLQDLVVTVALLVFLFYTYTLIANERTTYRS